VIPSIWSLPFSLIICCNKTCLEQKPWERLQFNSHLNHHYLDAGLILSKGAIPLECVSFHGISWVPCSSAIFWYFHDDLECSFGFLLAMFHPFCIPYVLQHMMREKGKVILVRSILLYTTKNIPTTTWLVDTAIFNRGNCYMAVWVPVLILSWFSPDCLNNLASGPQYQKETKEKELEG